MILKDIQCRMNSVMSHLAVQSLTFMRVVFNLLQSHVEFSFPLRVHFVIRKGDPGKRSEFKVVHQ